MSSFSLSMAIRQGVKNALESIEINSEVAAHIGSVASFFTAALVRDHHSEIIDPTSTIASHTVFDDAASHGVNQITTNSNDLTIEMENEALALLAAVKKNYPDIIDNSDSTKTKDIFSQIDLAQARIIKDQEEIQSLAKETDDLLNQLESKAS